MFVPESLKINQLLRQFRRQHMHIAIVLNEHGIVTGLITLEDILEEIVGEIADEHESATSKITKLKEGGWLVEATIPLEALEEALRITFTSEDSVTLGGFLSEKLQHLPKKGERLIYENYCFQVHKASNRRVQQVLIFEKKPTHDVQKKEQLLLKK
jgi:CBS domain containing-hemolysin-like protein